MSISSIYNNNYVNLKTNFVTQSQESLNSSYILKNVISKNSYDCVSSENCKVLLSANFTELKEELSKLETEVKKIERQVNDLEKSKIMKVTKVYYVLNQIDDLRKIIERIADETSFKRNYVNRQPTVRSKNINVKKTDSGKENDLISTVSFSTCCETEEEMEGEGKEDLCDSDDCPNYYQSNDHFNQCFLYWREYLPQPLMPQI